MNKIRKFFSNTNQGEPEVSTAKFTVKFTGPALDDGTMDVRDFAPALLAIEDSCARANQLMNGSSAKIKTNVNANFERGSFGFELQIFQVLADKEAMELVGNAVQVLTLAGFGVAVGSGLVKTGIGAIKKLQGKRPDKIEQKPGGNLNVQVNNFNFESTEQALALGMDPQFIQSIAKAVSPVKKEGIDSFQFGTNDDDPESHVTEADLDSFVAPDPKDDPPVIESTHETIYEIIAPSLQEGYKWRLGSDGGNIMVAIEDVEFLEDVNNGVYAFRAGDLLKVRIRQRAWQNPRSGVTRENTILKVIEHIQRPDAGLPEFPWKNDPEPTP